MTARRSGIPMPKGWPRIRLRILERDGHRCQWPEENHPGVVCGRRATTVDHKLPASKGGGDGDANLWALCSWHHDRKTGREANAARAPKPTMRRTPETHPGLLP